MPTPEALNEAVAAEVIDPAQADRLAAFWRGRGYWSANETLAPRSDIDDTEAPRFLRGFHDILITIGLAVGLGGLSAFAPIYFCVPVIWGLSELFIARQRLALPAVFLSVAWALTVYSSLDMFLPGLDKIFDSDDIWRFMSGVVLSTLTAAIVGVFFWRFRTPISLAGLCLSIAAALSFLLAFGFEWLIDAYPAVFDDWLLEVVLPLLGAAGLFAAAVRFDLSDPRRVTRRSDTAFWLHLAAAPALLLAVLNLLRFVTGSEGVFTDPDTGDVALVFVVVLGSVLIGLALDRRTFVTSGLISLGVAIAYIVQQLAGDIEDLIAVSAIILGVFVLVVAVGWVPMRRRLLGLLPPALASRLPPARPAAQAPGISPNNALSG